VHDFGESLRPPWGLLSPTPVWGDELTEFGTVGASDVLPARPQFEAPEAHFTKTGVIEDNVDVIRPYLSPVLQQPASPVVR